MVPTPAPLLQEGIAELGPGLVLDDDLRDRLIAALGRHGLDYEAERSEAARRPSATAAVSFSEGIRALSRRSAG